MSRLYELADGSGQGAVKTACNHLVVAPGGRPTLGQVVSLLMVAVIAIVGCSGDDSDGGLGPGATAPTETIPEERPTSPLCAWRDTDELVRDRVGEAERARKEWDAYRSETLALIDESLDLLPPIEELPEELTGPRDVNPRSAVDEWLSQTRDALDASKSLDEFRAALPAGTSGPEDPETIRERNVGLFVTHADLTCRSDSIADDQERRVIGEYLYRQMNCAGCHETVARSLADLDETFPAIDDALRITRLGSVGLSELGETTFGGPDDRLYEVQGGMPGFDDELTDEQISAILDYLIGSELL